MIWGTVSRGACDLCDYGVAMCGGHYLLQFHHTPSNVIWVPVNTTPGVGFEIALVL